MSSIVFFVEAYKRDKKTNEVISKPIVSPVVLNDGEILEIWVNDVLVYTETSDET